VPKDFPFKVTSQGETATISPGVIMSKESAKLTLEVGKRYVMRNGGITEKIQDYNSDDYPFTDGFKTWAESGEWSLDYEDKRDIIREATPEECGEVKSEPTAQEEWHDYLYHIESVEVFKKAFRAGWEARGDR
jgi:hypothetical protein